jgi:nucleoside-diphosphate-sugar epimerase
MVYGPGVRANFASLIKLVDSGLPLPFASIRNKRSLVALDNLVDLIITCIDHPGAANQTLLVSDGEDLSIAELVSKIAKSLGKSPRLIPFPPALLKLLARLIGRQAMARRICDSLQIDISSTRTLLGWEPPLTVEEAMRKALRNPDSD